MTRLGIDFSRSRILIPYSEDMSNITNFIFGSKLTDFLNTSEVRLLLPEPVNAKTPT
jgi:hypothetical protein